MVHIKCLGHLTTEGQNTSFDAYVDESKAWHKKAQFIFKCLSYVLGLGTLWRFPDKIYANGGGVFFLPYVIVLVLCALPTMYLELLVGQYCGVGPIRCWNLVPLFKGIGYAMVSIAFLMSIYQAINITWFLFYMFSSMRPIVQYTTCDNYWNTPECETLYQTAARCANQSFQNCTMFGETPAAQFYQNYVFNATSSIDQPGYINWRLLLLLILVWLVILYRLNRGMKTSGLFTIVSLLCVFIVLIMFLARSAVLEGSVKGVLYFLSPQWSYLTKPQTWLDAGSHAFFSLGPCMGVYMTLGSYNNYSRNLMRDAILVCVVDFILTVISGFIVFSSIGYYSTVLNLNVTQIHYPGESISLVTYSNLISNLTPSTAWGSLIFLAFVVLSFGSLTHLTNTVHIAIKDTLPHEWTLNYWRQKIIPTILCVIWFLLGFTMLTQAGHYWFELLDYFVTRWSNMTLCIATTISLTWIYGWTRFSDDMKVMLGHRPSLWWRAMWQFVTPALIFALLVMAVCTESSYYKLGNHVYPHWAIALGIFIGVVTLIPVVIFIVIGLIQSRFKLQKIKEMLRPEFVFGPFYYSVRQLWLLKTMPDYLNPLDTTTSEIPIEEDDLHKPLKFFGHQKQDDNDNQESDTIAMNKDLKSTWRRQMDFFIVCISYTLGLSNVFKFPMLCYRYGGGAFFLAYLLLMVVCGIPIYYLELSVGQYSGLGSFSVWKVLPLFTGLGYTTFILLLYQFMVRNVNLGWIVFYMFKTMSSSTTWNSCNNTWNTPNCISAPVNNLSFVFFATNEYFRNEFISMPDSLSTVGDIKWYIVLSVLFIYMIIGLPLLNGINILGKISYFSAIVPISLMLIILTWSIALNSDLTGVHRLVDPRWNELGSPELWYNAGVQVINSLGVGLGVTVTIAGHNSFHGRCKSVAISLCLIDTAFSAISTFTIFALLGLFATELGTTVENFMESGGSYLGFTSLPYFAATKNYGGLLAVIFYFTILTLGIGNQIIILLTLANSMDDMKRYITGSPMRHKIWIAAMFTLLAGLFLMELIFTTQGGYYLVQVVLQYPLVWPIFIVCILELVAMGWVYGIRRYSKRISMMSGNPISWYWMAMWCGISPTTLAFLIVYYWISPRNVDDVVPEIGGVIAGIVLLIIPLVFIPGYIVYHLIASKGSFLKRLRSLVTINPEWDPEVMHICDEVDEDYYTKRKKRRVSLFSDEMAIRQLPYNDAHQSKIRVPRRSTATSESEHSPGTRQSQNANISILSPGDSSNYKRGSMVLRINQPSFQTAQRSLTVDVDTPPNGQVGPKSIDDNVISGVPSHWNASDVKQTDILD